MRGRDVKRYAYEWAGLYLITTFPSLHLDIDDYPAVRDYLLAFGKRRLEQIGAKYIVNGVEIKSRKKSGNQWFEAQDAISYWDDFDKPKIVWGEISDRSKFALDSKGDYAVEATTFLMTGDNLDYLVCFLNSTLAEYLFSKIGTTTGVGTVRWKKYKLEQLYVPTENVDLRFFSETLHAYLTKHDASCLSAINGKIYDMCHLTSEEISFLETHALSSSETSSSVNP